MVALPNKLAHERLQNGSLIPRAFVGYLWELLPGIGAGKCGGEQLTGGGDSG